MCGTGFLIPPPAQLKQISLTERGQELLNTSLLLEALQQLPYQTIAISVLPFMSFLFVILSFAVRPEIKFFDYSFLLHFSTLKANLTPALVYSFTTPQPEN